MVCFFTSLRGDVRGIEEILAAVRAKAPLRRSHKTTILAGWLQSPVGNIPLYPLGLLFRLRAKIQLFILTCVTSEQNVVA